MLNWFKLVSGLWAILGTMPRPATLASRIDVGQGINVAHWTYWLQILSELCFQRVALSGNYEIVTISTDKNTFFNDLDYKADIGQHFH